MISNGFNNGSVYFRISWQVWQILGCIDLNNRTYGSYQFWRGLLLNMLATVVYPITLLMAVGSFDRPLDNLTNFNISITSVATVVKFIMYASQLNKVVEIEQVLVELDRRVDTTKQRAMHKSMSNELQFITKMFILAYGITAVNTEGSFLIKDERTLPFPAWFPLDWKNSMSSYLLALSYQFLSITAQILQNFVDDIFPPLMLCLLARNCELLCQRIAVIGHDQSDQRVNEKQLYNCVRDHQLVYRLHELTMDIISSPMLVQFIVIAIDVGTAMCGLVFFVETQQERLYYICFIFALFLQIFPSCYYGTLVEYVFESLHYAVFSSIWYEQSAAYRRTAIIFAHRTQRTPQLLAGNVIPIALTTFLGNCKAAYSFFTLIADARK